MSTENSILFLSTPSYYTANNFNNTTLTTTATISTDIALGNTGTSNLGYYEWICTEPKEYHYHYNYPPYDYLTKKDLEKFFDKLKKNELPITGDSFPKIDYYTKTVQVEDKGENTRSINNILTYCYDVYLAGYKKENLHVYILNNVLVIKGTSEKETDDSKSYVHKESKKSSFERKLLLSEECDIDKMSYVFEDGILTIEFPVKKDVYRELKL